MLSQKYFNWKTAAQFIFCMYLESIWVKQCDRNSPQMPPARSKPANTQPWEQLCRTAYLLHYHCFPSVQQLYLDEFSTMWDSQEPVEGPTVFVQ